MHSRGLQTHFKAVVVSQQFEGLNRVKRHQKVYGTLGELMGEFMRWRCTPTPPKNGRRSTRPRLRRRVPVAASADWAAVDGKALSLWEQSPMGVSTCGSKACSR